MFSKSKHDFLYKSIEIHTSANAYVIATGVNQKKIRSSAKENVKWMHLKFWRMKNIFPRL